MTKVTNTGKKPQNLKDLFMDVVHAYEEAAAKRKTSLGSLFYTATRPLMTCSVGGGAMLVCAQTPGHALVGVTAIASGLALSALDYRLGLIR